MKVIHKFQIRNVAIDDDIQTIAMPEGAEILKVGLQSDILTIWATVPIGMNQMRKRRFMICPTGGSTPEGESKYLDTVFLGPYVWHIFEVL